MAGDLGAGIYHAQFAYGERFVVHVVVQSLAVLRQDGRERSHITAADYDALHGSHKLLLQHSGLHQSHSGVVHRVAQVAGAVNLFYLAGLLYKSLCYNGFDEFFADAVVHRRGGGAQNLGQQDLVVGAVLRYVVHLAALGKSIGHKAGQSCKGVGLPYSNLCRLVGNALLRTHPDDVVYVDVVAKNHLSTAVDVNHRRQ